MRVICDVDAILWDFHGPLIDHLGLPPATSWDWYREHGVSDEEFYAAVDRIHESQLAYDPFPGADRLLTVLSKKGEVIIASHRESGAAANLAEWLLLNLPDVWSGLYTGQDKSFLWQPGDIVIDDAPHTIQKAWSEHCRVGTILYPWNEKVVNKINSRPEYVRPEYVRPWADVRAFQNLEELTRWVGK